MIAVAPGAELNVSFVAHPDFCDVSCTDHSPLKISQRFDEDFTVLIERSPFSLLLRVERFQYDDAILFGHDLEDAR